MALTNAERKTIEKFKVRAQEAEERLAAYANSVPRAEHEAALAVERGKATKAERDLKDFRNDLVSAQREALTVIEQATANTEKVSLALGVARVKITELTGEVDTLTKAKAALEAEVARLNEALRLDDPDVKKLRRRLAEAKAENERLRSVEGQYAAVVANLDQSRKHNKNLLLAVEGLQNEVARAKAGATLQSKPEQVEAQAEDEIEESVG